VKKYSSVCLLTSFIQNTSEQLAAARSFSLSIKKPSEWPSLTQTDSRKCTLRYQSSDVEESARETERGKEMMCSQGTGYPARFSIQPLNKKMQECFLLLFVIILSNNNLPFER